MKESRVGLQSSLSAAPECDLDTIPVHVYCRLRPPAVLEKINWLHVRNATTIEVNVPQEWQQLPRGTLRKCEYSFRQVFNAEAKQQEVFQAVAKPLVENLIMGRNSLLLSYGITGSGKTYTMTGNAEHPGVIQLALFEIFNTIGDNQTESSVLKADGMNGFELRAECVAQQGALRLETPDLVGKHSQARLYAVFLNYIEFYNNSVYDLLEQGGLQKPLQSRLIREDAQRNQMYVHGVTEVEVKCFEEALEVFQFGQKRKRVAHTLLNTASSRSHSSFNIRLVHLLNDKEREHTVATSQLSLVDLAGSERSSRTKNCGIRLREASSINNSLLTLRTCLEYLRENQQAAAGAQTKKIPYRDAKLTHMFKHFFEGAGQVCMIVCINTQLTDFGENLHVFKFAEMTKELQIARPTEQPKMKLAHLQINVTEKSALMQRQAEQAAETEMPEYDRPLNMTDCHFVLGPNFPQYEQLQGVDAGVVFEQLKAYLQQRISCRQVLRSQLECHFDLVHQQLLQSQQENGDLRQVLAKTSDALQEALAQQATLAQQLSAVEARSAKLAQNLLKRQSQFEALQLQMSAKDELLQRKLQNESCWKESMRYQVAYVKEQTSCEFDVELRKRTEEYEEQIRIKDEKLRLVSNILQAEDMPTLRQSMSSKLPQSMHAAQVLEEEKVNRSVDANTQTMRTLMPELRLSTKGEANVEDITIVEAKTAYFKKNF